MKKFNSLENLKSLLPDDYKSVDKINYSKKIPLNKKFVKDYDNIESAFAKTAKDNNVNFIHNEVGYNYSLSNISASLFDLADSYLISQSSIVLNTTPSEVSTLVPALIFNA